MFLIVGYIIILASALGTYSVHGSLAALWVPLEYIAIVGLTVGGFVAGNDIKIIKATVGALPGIFKGSKFTKALYVDLLAMLFEVLAKVRKEGLRFLPDSVVRMLPGEISKPVAALTNKGRPDGEPKAGSLVPSLAPPKSPFNGKVTSNVSISYHDFAIADLRNVGVDVLTLGQYLRPSARHHRQPAAAACAATARRPGRARPRPAAASGWRRRRWPRGGRSRSDLAPASRWR